MLIQARDGSSLAWAGSTGGGETWSEFEGNDQFDIYSFPSRNTYILKEDT